MLPYEGQKQILGNAYSVSSCVVNVSRCGPAIRAAQATPGCLRLPQAARGQSLSTGRGATKWMHVGRLL